MHYQGVGERAVQLDKITSCIRDQDSWWNIVLGDFNFAMQGIDRLHIEGGSIGLFAAEHAFKNKWNLIRQTHGLCEIEQPQFTCVRLSHRSVSVLDHIFSSHHPSQQLVADFNCRVLQQKHNLSDHVPLI